jgi:thioredoxin 1
MRRRDAVVVAAVVGMVAGVGLVREHRPQAALVPVPAPSAGIVQPGAVERQAAQRVPRMVDLGAGRCVPCRRMAPILAELGTEYAGRAEVVFIDVWEQPERADGFRFRMIPTQIFYDREGREAWRHEGFLDKPGIVAQFRRLGVE